MQSLIKSAPAKINLHLHITGRMENGYHSLDSLVAFTDYCDTLKITPSPAYQLKTYGADNQEIVIDCEGSDNIITRATHQLAQKYNIQPNFLIELTKRIPIAAGLGGGSADAAAILLTLKDLWPQITHEDIIEVAASLGSDIVACIHNRPVIMRETGNTILGAPILPELFGVLVNPNQACSTPLVYKTYALRKADFSKTINFPDKFLTPQELYSFLNTYTSNDLTNAAIEVCPIIGAVLAELKTTEDCRLARLSGSGSTCFALYDTQTAAISAAETIRKTHQDWWVEPFKINNSQI